MMPPRSQGKLIWFSTTELKHLLAGVLLTLAIGFSMPLYSMPELYGYPELLTALAAVFAFSFIIHELAHKITAQRHGLWAEFRITMFGALITMVSIISPFKIISPGAVMVGGMADKETIGKTSIAGPVTNIVLALALLAISQIFDGLFGFVFYFGLLINSFIALFNLIPFGVLDGYKVFLWSKMIWAVMFSISLALTIYSYVVFPLS
jgi:Zn-dependent protease